jgi:hypothetical protein
VIAISLYCQVVASVCKCVEDRLYMADVQIGFCDRQSDLWAGRLGASHSTIRLEEDRSRHLTVKP